MKPTITAVLLSVLLSACGARTPRIPFGGVDAGIGPFLVAHPLAEGQNFRADEVGRSATASYHLVQVRVGESPHRHAAHDLTVFLLRGHGLLNLESRHVALAAGDAAVIPRGAVHWFVNHDRTPAVTFVMFTPPLDAPDSVPADAR